MNDWRDLSIPAAELDAQLEGIDSYTQETCGARKGDTSVNNFALPDDYDYTWRQRAACLGIDSELFFPEGVSRVSNMQTEDAKKICGQCAVRAECSDFALASSRSSGVFGGTSENQRQVMRRERRKRAD